MSRLRTLDLFSGIGADQLRADYDSGLTQAEIAAKYDTTQKRVFGAMRRFGVKARVAAKRDQFGPANHMWKGDGATVIAFHRRLYSRYGKPAACTVCGTTKSNHYDFANLSGRYEDLNDYAAMCRSCHWKYDKKHLNFTVAREVAHVEGA